MKHYPIILLTALGLLAGCNKEEKPEYVYLSAEIKRHFYFKQGSYWIYTDALSGRTDSFYLNKSDVSTATSEWTNVIGQVLNLDIIQKVSDSNIKDEIHWLYQITNTDVVATYKKNNEEIWVTSNKFYSSYDKLVPYPPGYLRFYSGYVGDLQVNGTFFKNVWTASYTDSLASSKSFSKIQHFYNDSVGFVMTNVDYNANSVAIKELWQVKNWLIIK